VQEQDRSAASNVDLRVSHNRNMPVTRIVPEQLKGGKCKCSPPDLLLPEAGWQVALVATSPLSLHSVIDCPSSSLPAPAPAVARRLLVLFN